MVGRTLAVFAVFAAATSLAAQAPILTTPSRFGDLYRAYERGQPDIIASTLQSRTDLEGIRVDYLDALAQWRTAWDPRHATFALEVAIRAYEVRWTDPWRLLIAARDLVTTRPDPPGAKSENDRFELTFHKAAIAYLAGVPMPDEVGAYLAPIAARVTTGMKTRTPPALSDARVMLAAAMAEETRTLPAGLGATGTLRSWVISPGDGALRTRLEGVIDMLTPVAAAPDTAAEVAIRRAFLLHRLGAHARALETLDAAPPTSDPVVGYWRALIRGRVLSSVGRLDDAAEAFERAAALHPQAQTPAIALSVLLLKVNQRDRAMAWATRARTTTAAGADPWPQYWLGDRRFLAGWIADLRRAQP